MDPTSHGRMLSVRRQVIICNYTILIINNSNSYHNIVG